MPEVYPIHDLYVQSITPIKDQNKTRWRVLRDTDHLLRRFGLAEVVHIKPNTNPTLHVREVADEIWALIIGKVEFIWHDLRQDSPTHDRTHRLVCEQPTLILVPFGVAFGCRTLGEPATLLRLATHADGEHDRDRELPWGSET